MSGALRQTMRPGDAAAFRDAAVKVDCWILVRETNPASLPYIALADYVPKPIDCKPKTADKNADGKKLAGLVIVPGFHPDAFSTAKKIEAVEEWASFLLKSGISPCTDARLSPSDRARDEAWRLMQARREYSVDVDVNSKHYGCLKLNGKWIHGDYDLKDIVVVGHERAQLALISTLRGQPHMVGPRLKRVQDLVNPRIGKPMVQHSGSAQFQDHKDELIDVFSPRGEHDQLPNLAAIKAWYDKMQRPVIDVKKRL